MGSGAALDCLASGPGVMLLSLARLATCVSLLCCVQAFEQEQGFQDDEDHPGGQGVQP